MDERLRRLAIGRGASIREAMHAIDRGAYEIALMLNSDERLVGTVTDGDLRRALLGGASLDDPVESYVSEHPFTVGPNAARADILDVMRAHSIAQVPVLDDRGRLLGLHVMRELVGAVERPNWAVIMAGGRGTRLGGLTDDVPKPMLKVAGRPILERTLLHLVGLGIRRVFISVNYLAEVIIGHFEDGADFGCEIEYLCEKEPLGTAGSLSLLSEQAGTPEHPFLVVNGDLVTQFSVGDLLEHHVATDAHATVGIREHRYEIPFGTVEYDDEGHLAQLVEKPTVSWDVSSGIYALSPEVLGVVPPGRYEMPDVIRECRERGYRVAIWRVDSDWVDVGRPQELRRARGEV